MIYNRELVFEYKGKPEELLDALMKKLKKSLPRGHIPLRFAVVKVQGKKLWIEASVMD